MTAFELILRLKAVTQGRISLMNLPVVTPDGLPITEADFIKDSAGKPVAIYLTDAEDL